MRYIRLSLILIVSFSWTACDNEKVDHAANFEFETIDKEANQINLHVAIRYTLKSRLDKKLPRKYGTFYRDSLFLPAISSVSRKVLKDYSVGEIYSYRREEIETKLGEQTKATFAEYEIELTSFFINSVELADTLLARLEKEHIARFQKVMNNCRREIKGVITEIHDMKSDDDLVFYEFEVEKKNYKGILSPQDAVDKVSIGDSVAIEYACEDPVFHRLKK
jgi:hypothetical protein